MEPGYPLYSSEIHGFLTAGDLDINKLLEDASMRWFRPNEVHAILSNTLLEIQPRPVDVPASGSVLLFDRKVLRNFRKDGHNWRKKKDGKTVQEAHEKLKIGNEERIHVYYARNESDPNFHRRCYWLLDKNLDRIVLVHYRQTAEDNATLNHVPVGYVEALSITNRTQQGSPLTPVNSTSGSTHSEMSGSILSEEINSQEDCAIYSDDRYPRLGNMELTLHAINTLDWADLVESPTYINSMAHREGNALPSYQQRQYELKDSVDNGSLLQSHSLAEGISSFGHPTNAITGYCFENVEQMDNDYFPPVKNQETASTLSKSMNTESQANNSMVNPVGSNGTLDISTDEVFLTQNSFGRWNDMNYDSLGSLDDLQLECPTFDGLKSDALTIMEHSPCQEQPFNIIDVSPAWAYSTEETKVILIGYFHESHKHLAGSNILCVFGGICVAAEIVQSGVYRCMALPHTPGVVNLFLTLDGHTPISQVLSFEYRSFSNVQLNDGVTWTSSVVDNDKTKMEEFKVQIRLAHLLFSTTNNLSILSSRVSSNTLMEVKRFASVTSSSSEKDWMRLLKLVGGDEISYIAACQDLFELVLKNKLQEWLLGKVAEGSKITAHDSKGQGVIHLCAILDYAWAVHLFSFSGLSLDFRDAFGWTALHWAAYCGREKMVAALLSAGANPSLVTDPTAESPGGCTAADLASKEGYEGLGAYLAEKGLAAHFQAMSLSGNISTNVPPSSTNQGNPESLYYGNLSEKELCLKESLAAYRNAADAADRIQAAFRERTLKLQTKATQIVNPEMEVANIVAALKIQHAFRNYNRRKLMKAAARIQSHFRFWKTRKNFVTMRQQAIRIQAVFRGHQVRRQYRKIMWSVGVLEKAILRWRLKRKGLRGIQVEATSTMVVGEEQENTAAEDFYRISQRQAEERVKRSVVRVQAMFRSYRAQQEYRRMKLAHDHAKLEFDEFNRSP